MNNQPLLLLAQRGLLEIAEPRGNPVARGARSLAPAGEQIYQYMMPGSGRAIVCTNLLLFLFLEEF